MKTFFLLLLCPLFIQLSAQTHDWSISYGSSGSERNSGITISPNGDILSIGYFAGTVDFDPSSNNSSSSSNGSRDISIVSFTSTGSFLWKKTVGGTGQDFGVSITTDTTGNIYTTGAFSNTCDFDPGSAISNLSSNGNTDIFINKLDSAGNLIWAKSFGGSGEDRGMDIKVTLKNEVLITGFFKGTVDFDPGIGITNKTSNGGENIFICKLDSLGNFLWVNTYGSSNSILRERGRGIETNKQGEIFLTGYFGGTSDFDPGTGVLNVMSNGSIDGFITKLDSNGALIWVKTWGGLNQDIVTDFIRSDSGNIYISGLFEGTSDFNPGPSTENKTSNGSFDPFVLKLDQSGIFKWAKTIGSSSYDAAIAVTLDQDENIIFCGSFNGTMDCDPDTSVFNISSPAPQIGFTCKFKNNGEFDWAFPIKSTSVNGSTDDVVSDGIGFIYMTGMFSGSNIDFDPQSSISTLTSNGSSDAFIHKIIDCNPTFDTLFELACNSYTSPSGNYTWNKNGTYNDTLLSIIGCDSILTINLFITNSRDTINATSCSSFISPSGNYSWDSTGTYFDTIPGGINCDSLLLINLTISKPDTSITFNALTLTSNDTGLVSYQWLDCNNGYSRISGETSRSYNATYSSDFAVEVSNSSCSDTSLCYTILITGINAQINSELDIRLFPNPSKEFFIIELNKDRKGQYNLISMSGKSIDTGWIKNTTTKVSLANIPKGVYFLEINLENEPRIIKKVIVH